MKRLAIGLTGLTLAGVVQAEMFKCTDAAGHITFSQTRCAEDAAPANVSVSRPSAEQAQAAQQFWSEIGAQQDAIRAQRAAANEADRIRTEQQSRAEQNRRQAQRTLKDWGTPTSTFRSGSYESRTYQRGNTIQTIRMQDGQITGSSTYRSNR